MSRHWLRRLADFPTELAAAARDLAPHQITFYLKDLAQEFHSYYNAERSWSMTRRSGEPPGTGGRRGAGSENGLAVLSISAPEQM